MSDRRAYRAIAIVFGCVAIGFLASGRATWVVFFALAVAFGALSTERARDRR